jgi:hypothetical protein
VRFTAKDLRRKDGTVITAANRKLTMGNRMAKYFEQQDSENFGVCGQEPFVICPSSLLAGLSQQQLAAQQQLYQTALEKARAQVEQRKAQWWSSDDLGAGI